MIWLGVGGRSGGGGGSEAPFLLALLGREQFDAQGALDELTRLALGKRRLYASSSLADSPVFQLHLGRAETTVRAARALLRDLAGEFAARVAADPAAVPGFDPAAAAALAWITEVASAAVDACYRAGAALLGRPVGIGY